MWPYLERDTKPYIMGPDGTVIQNRVGTVNQVRTILDRAYQFDTETDVRSSLSGLGFLWDEGCTGDEFFFQKCTVKMCKIDEVDIEDFVSLPELDGCQGWVSFQHAASMTKFVWLCHIYQIAKTNAWVRIPKDLW
ncbi:hypothetical protein C5167_026115 [Papaver somniferum]|nr:hypothetical protein C5167_026115 [Papaver somniferum]